MCARVYVKACGKTIGSKEIMTRAAVSTDHQPEKEIACVCVCVCVCECVRERETLILTRVEK